MSNTEENDNKTTQEENTAEQNDTNVAGAVVQGNPNDSVTLADQLRNEYEKRLKLMADFENYKKRVEQEKALFGAMANMSLIQEILEVNDDLELAKADESLDVERAKESIGIAQDKIKALVKSAGVEAIDVNLGDDFNKDFMEAIQAIPDENNKNKVIAIISSAYKYSDREGVLKSAKVIVGK